MLLPGRASIGFCAECQVEMHSGAGMVKTEFLTYFTVYDCMQVKMNTSFFQAAICRTDTFTTFDTFKGHHMVEKASK